MPTSAEKLRRQILALEVKYSNAVRNNEPNKVLFPLMGKIKQLKRQLETAVRFDWLAK